MDTRLENPGKMDFQEKPDSGKKQKNARLQGRIPKKMGNPRRKTGGIAEFGKMNKKPDCAGGSFVQKDEFAISGEKIAKTG